MKFLEVKNWSEFQHYKDRCPPWIKLHKGLLDDYSYAALSGNAGKSLVLLWLLASEHGGSIPYDLHEIAFRLRITEAKAALVVNELLRERFMMLTEASQEAEKWPTRYVSKKIRGIVFKRDKGECQECESKENIEYDHIKPVSQGGESTEDNLQLLCRSCNRKKRVRVAGATQTVERRSLETETETETEKRQRRFVVPTAKEASDYAKTIDFELDGEAFVDHYATNGWMRGNTKIKDWKACVRTWKKRRAGDTGKPPEETDPTILDYAKQFLAIKRRPVALGGEYQDLYAKIRDNCGPTGVDRVKAAAVMLSAKQKGK